MRTVEVVLVGLTFGLVVVYAPNEQSDTYTYGVLVRLLAKIAFVLHPRVERRAHRSERVAGFHRSLPMIRERKQPRQERPVIAYVVVF